MSNATFAKIHSDNSWGIRFEGPLAVGDMVTVERRDGQISSVKVTEIVWRGGDVIIARFEKNDSEPRQKAAPKAARKPRARKAAVVAPDAVSPLSRPVDEDSLF